MIEVLTGACVILVVQIAALFGACYLAAALLIFMLGGLKLPLPKIPRQLISRRQL